MAEIKDYSVTADDNDSASPNGMPEGMAPSGVNNSWRESFARVKRWYEDVSAAKTTTGSSNAYVLAAARVVTAYAAGDAYMIKANHTCTSAGSTLNIDSVGAKSIVTPAGAALGAGDITSGGIYIVAYEASADKFMLLAGGSTFSGDITAKTSDGAILNLQTSDTTVTSGSVLGRTDFKAPDEASGTDAILLAASIAAVSESTFAADNNATKLSFMTAASGAAVEVASISSVGNVTMKQTATGDDTPMTLLLQTGETDIALDDALAKIQFQAPDEGAGTDAILVAAEIAAISEGDFSSSNNATKLSFKTAASGATSEKMSISSVGNVTMKETETGDDTPMTLSLTTGEVDIETGDVLGKIEWSAPDEGTGTDSRLVSGAIDCVSEGDFSSSSNASKLSFRTGASEAATEKMQLSSGGNLQVSGTYTGGGLMTTGGNIVIPDDGLIGSASDNDALKISAAGALTVQAGGAAATPAVAVTTGALGVNGMYVGTANILSFVTSGTERMRIDASGNVILTTASAGIYLGVTAATAANHLDDYEEGTFTATLIGITAAPTSAVTVTANYVKIGRLVQFDIAFSNVDCSGGSGSLRINGLPFAGTAATTTGPLMSYRATITGTKGTYWYFDTNALNLYYNNTDGGWGWEAIRSATAQYFWTSGTYRTAS